MIVCIYTPCARFFFEHSSDMKQQGLLHGEVFMKERPTFFFFCIRKKSRLLFGGEGVMDL